MDAEVGDLIGPSDLYRPPPAAPRPASEAVRYARDEFGDAAPGWLLELAARRASSSNGAPRPRMRDSLVQFAKRAASFLL